MLQQLYADVYCWSERHGKAEASCNWNSFAIHVEQADVLALVDPLPLSPEEFRVLEELVTPTHILLTCNWHLRQSRIFRQRWGCEIYVNELGLEGVEIPIDGTFKHGDRLWDCVEVIHIPHVDWLEETAFLVEQGNGLLIIGDAVCGGRTDIGVPDGEVGIYWTRYKPLTDFHDVRSSLHQLMEYPFEAMCFGHGSPILSQAKKTLGRFIDTGLSK